MNKVIREWFNFIVVFGVIGFALATIVPKMLPSYEKYKAGEYRESVPCEESKPVCFFKQMEYTDGTNLLQNIKNGDMNK